MHRKLFFFALLLVAAASPATADPAKTAAATDAFLSALTALENAIYQYRDMVKKANLLPQDVDPICAMMNPSGPAEELTDQTSLGELLDRAKTTRDQAKAVCRALDDERALVDKARLANIGAARECAINRIAACDKVNEVLAAQARARAAEQAELP